MEFQILERGFRQGVKRRQDGKGGAMSPIILNTRELPRLKIYNHHVISLLPTAPFRNFSLVNSLRENVLYLCAAERGG